MEALFNSETATLLEPDGVLLGFISTINILDATPDVVARAEYLLAFKHSGSFRELNAPKFKNGQAGERSVASIWSRLTGRGRGERFVATANRGLIELDVSGIGVLELMKDGSLREEYNSR
jgi:hypothetical protein